MPCIYALMMMILVISKIFPVRIILYLIKALYYPKKVLAGIKHAGHVLPGNFLGQHYLTFELLQHPVWSTLIRPDLYRSEIFMMLLRQLSYAIKNQLVTSKAPSRGLWM